VYVDEAMYGEGIVGDIRYYSPRTFFSLYVYIFIKI